MFSDAELAYLQRGETASGEPPSESYEYELRRRIRKKLDRGVLHLQVALNSDHYPGLYDEYAHNIREALSDTEDYVEQEFNDRAWSDPDTYNGESHPWWLDWDYDVLVDKEKDGILMGKMTMDDVDISHLNREWNEHLAVPPTGEGLDWTTARDWWEMWHDRAKQYGHRDLFEETWGEEPPEDEKELAQRRPPEEVPDVVLERLDLKEPEPEPGVDDFI